MNGVKIEKLAKELCEKSGCHHKCHDTKDCVVEDEAREVIANSATTTEKQIEEMAWDLCDIPKHPSIKSCLQCGNKRCHAMYYAERAYNAGYRKQSDIEQLVNEIFDEVEKCVIGTIEPSFIQLRDKYIAKMKGGE